MTGLAAWKSVGVSSRNTGRHGSPFFFKRIFPDNGAIFAIPQAKKADLTKTHKFIALGK
jgi:hypothetical protein